MRSLAALLALVCALGSCAGDAPPPPSELGFVDSQIFEKQLRESLAADHPTVTVLFRGTDATVNRLPERLDKWLYVVSKQDGSKVDFVPDPAFPASKGVLGIALGVGMMGYKLIEKEVHYFPVRAYDATVYYHPATGTLTRVVFTHKPEA
jgi:hypothetical protein